jgi:hypothetical protein
VKSVYLLAIGTVASAATVTFNKDVLPLLQKNCQTCHRPGEIGPMSFLTYESTRPYAKAIKNAVVTKKMPPWFAESAPGHFMNDKRLSDADIKTLVAWVDGGAVEGDAKDKPAPVQWTDGWNIKPDVVFEMQKPYHVQAKGTIEYTYFVIPTNFKEDRWIVDGEIRAGNRRVVHHASVHVRPPGSLWMKDAKPGEPYVPPKAPELKENLPAPVDPRFTVNEWLLGYVPGVHAEYFDLNHRAAKLLPAGSDLVFEMHYTAKEPRQKTRPRSGLCSRRSLPKSAWSLCRLRG